MERIYKTMLFVLFILRLVISITGILLIPHQAYAGGGAAGHLGGNLQHILNKPPATIETDESTASAIGLILFLRRNWLWDAGAFHDIFYSELFRSLLMPETQYYQERVETLRDVNWQIKELEQDEFDKNFKVDKAIDELAMALSLSTQQINDIKSTAEECATKCKRYLFNIPNNKPTNFWGEEIPKVARTYWENSRDKVNIILTDKQKITLDEKINKWKEEYGWISTKDTGSQTQGDIVYVGGKDLFVINMTNRQILAKIPIGEKINDIAIVKNMGKVYLATSVGLVEIDIVTHRLIGNPINRGKLDSVEASPDGKRLYLLVHTGGPHKIEEFDLVNEVPIREVTLELFTYDIFLSPDREYLYATNQFGEEINKIPLDKIEIAEKIKIINGSINSNNRSSRILRTLFFSPNGKKIYMAESDKEKPSAIWEINTATNSISQFYLPHTAQYQGSAISKDGKILFLNALTHLYIVNIIRKEEIKNVPLDGIHRGIALSNDGKRVYLTKPVSEDKGYVTIVDIEASKIIGSVEIPGYVDVIGVLPE